MHLECSYADLRMNGKYACKLPYNTNIMHYATLSTIPEWRIVASTESGSENR